MKQSKGEGYWNDGSKGCKLPFPKPSPSSWPGKGKFMAALVKRQKECPEPKACKGSSTCRLCGIKNGSSSYEHPDGWHWPDGYMHYVKVHNVKPSEAFHKFVLQNTSNLKTWQRQLFMGDGDNSLAGVGRLFIDLSTAIDLINATQQLGLYGSTPGEDELTTNTRKIDRLAASIYESLTGRRIRRKRR